jgi:hypothetical protein
VGQYFTGGDKIEVFMTRKNILNPCKGASVKGLKAVSEKL